MSATRWQFPASYIPSIALLANRPRTGLWGAWVAVTQVYPDSLCRRTPNWLAAQRSISATRPEALSPISQLGKDLNREWDKPADPTLAPENALMRTGQIEVNSVILNEEFFS